MFTCELNLERGKLIGKTYQIHTQKIIYYTCKTKRFAGSLINVNLETAKERERKKNAIVMIFRCVGHSVRFSIFNHFPTVERLSFSVFFFLFCLFFSFFSEYRSLSDKLVNYHFVVNFAMIFVCVHCCIRAKMMKINRKEPQ